MIEVPHGFTERTDGDFKDAGVLEQVHGDVILKLDRRPEGRPKADGSMTNVPGLELVVRTADCQAGLFYDPVRRAVAAIHSGWRGSALNIVGKAVAQMHRVYGSQPRDIQVTIGPSLGPCCATFTDPFTELPAFMHAFVRGKNVDLWALSRRQLADAGVRPEHLELRELCTRCHPERFFSHRRGDSGRMKAWISLSSSF